MTTKSPYSDEELTAFLDGELDDAASAAIESRLSSDPGLQARLDLLAAPTQQIREAFDAVLPLSPAPPPHIAAAQPTKDVARTTPWKLTAVACLVAAIAAPVGWIVSGAFDQRTKLDDWRDYAAAYHALYVPETLSSSDHDAAQRQAQVDRAGQMLRAELSPYVEPFETVVFRRAQVLGFDGEPLIQLAFQSASGLPIALCIVRSDGAPDVELSFEDFDQLRTASWTREGLSFMLISGDAELTEAFAQSIVDRS
ncbi:MAG: hypothetical protein AAGF51_08310 [Pseudomonadota bacterium]